MITKAFQEEDEGNWIIEDVSLANSRVPIRISVTQDSAPTSEETTLIEKTLTNIEPLILNASALILDNYSYEHFKNLNVAEDKLVEETAEAIASVVTLQELTFYNVENGEFAASFTVPWDDHHTFDVEYEDGEATSCSVNG